MLKVNILNVLIDNVTMNDAMNSVHNFLNNNKVNIICTPNSEIIMMAQKDLELKSIINSSDLATADGIGVIIASKILKTPLYERVSGFDLAVNMLSIDMGRKIKVFLLGGNPGIAEKAADNIRKQYPYAEIVGHRHGYFSRDDESSIISLINASNTDILMVALGAPLQEKWISSHKEHLKVKICIGVGGSFDVLAGQVKRAPLFFQKNGLEWLYRIFKQPRRIIRAFALPKFIARVLLKKISYIIGGILNT